MASPTSPSCEYRVEVQFVPKGCCITNLVCTVPVTIYAPQPSPEVWAAQMPQAPPGWNPQMFSAQQLNVPPPAYSQAPPPQGVVGQQPGYPTVGQAWSGVVCGGVEGGGTATFTATVGFTRGGDSWPTHHPFPVGMRVTGWTTPRGAFLPTTRVCTAPIWRKNTPDQVEGGPRAV